jgi:riboflavin biosynthesis pyrimidine reductase
VLELKDDPALDVKLRALIFRSKRAAAEIMLRSKIRVDQEVFRARRASALPAIAARIKKAAQENPRLVSNPAALREL